MRLAADAAAREGRVLDEYDALVFAVRDFERLAAEFPKHRTAEVLEKGEAARSRLEELARGIKNGTIPVPDPDDAASGAPASAEPAQGAQQAPAPAIGSDRYPIPQLVTTTRPQAPAPAAGETAPSGETEPPPPDPAHLARLAAPIPNPFFDRASPIPDSTKPAEADAPAPTAESAPTAGQAPIAKPAPTAESRPPAGNALPSAPVPPAAAPAAPPPPFRTLRSLVESGQASEAVLLLEDALEEMPDRESAQAVAFRTLLARAYLECHNPARAEDELAALPESAAAEPAVQSLRAALAIARGRYAEAILQLHLLVSENPNWADAYVDLSWAHFLLDPSANRTAAISYYESALSRGASRDPALERALRVKIDDDPSN